jgi:hypothetical protein
METTFDLVEFQQRLGETIAWYLSKAPVSDPEYGLRTAELRPPAVLETPTERGLGNPPIPWTAEAAHEYWHRVRLSRLQVLVERQAIVDEVIRKRQVLLSASHIAPSQMTELFYKGRLLTYNPDGNLSDGAAPLNSERFFDDENVPPWDTWLMYVVDNIPKHKTYLITWVPPEFLKLAQAGIEANPEQCIRWAEDVDAEFVHQLRDAGLLR